MKKTILYLGLFFSVASEALCYWNFIDPIKNDHFLVVMLLPKDRPLSDRELKKKLAPYGGDLDRNQIVRMLKTMERNQLVAASYDPTVVAATRFYRKTEYAEEAVQNSLRLFLSLAPFLQGEDAFSSPVPLRPGDSEFTFRQAYILSELRKLSWPNIKELFAAISPQHPLLNERILNSSVTGMLYKYWIDRDEKATPMRYQVSKEGEAALKAIVAFYAQFSNRKQPD